MSLFNVGPTSPPAPRNVVSPCRACWRQHCSASPPRTLQIPFNLEYPVTEYDTRTHPSPLWSCWFPIAPRLAPHVRSVLRPHRRMSLPVSHQQRFCTHPRPRSPCWSPAAPMPPPVQWGRRVPPRGPRSKRRHGSCGRPRHRSSNAGIFVEPTLLLPSPDGGE